MDVDVLKPDILKQEIELVFEKINHFDNLRHRTKQMAVTLWATAIGAGVSLNSRALIGLAALVPIPFWYFDATYHAYQEGYQTRLRAIRKFLRTEHWERPADAQRYEGERNPNGFPIPDYYAKGSVCNAVHDRETSVLRNAFKAKTLIFYPLLFLAAVCLFAFFQLVRRGG